MAQIQIPMPSSLRGVMTVIFANILLVAGVIASEEVMKGNSDKQSQGIISQLEARKQDPVLAKESQALQRVGWELKRDAEAAEQILQQDSCSRDQLHTLMDLVINCRGYMEQLEKAGLDLGDLRIKFGVLETNYQDFWRSVKA